MLAFPKIRLSKLESTNDNLRQNVNEGNELYEPTVGQSYVFIGEALDKSLGSDSFRQIKTSTVMEVNKLTETSTEIKTRNSTYLIEYL